MGARNRATAAAVAPIVSGVNVGFVDFLDRLANGLVAVVRLVCIAFAAAIFVIVIVAVVARYGFGQAVSWTEEVPRYLLIWVSFLGAAACVLKREHVGFDVILNALPRPLRRATSTAISLMIFGFGAVMLRYGIDFVRDFGGDLMETIPFKNYWYYPAMPVAGALMMVFALKVMVDDLVGRGPASHTASVE
jgi:TRAP-type transport system small permease protein